MCGIVGLINFSGKPVDAEALRDASQMLRLRGPDDSGVWAQGSVGFAHRRLSIIDLSDAGRQPMVDHSGRYVCVFNGEIYNFREIRQQLQADGVQFSSQSDTEILLESFSRWGLESVNRFDGMFAFVIFDTHSRTIFAARDRFGQKPLYYFFDGIRFAFASRPAALSALVADVGLTYDPQALRYYLEVGYIPAPHSIFAQIKKLPAAHTLTVSAKGLTVKRYWDIRTLGVNCELLNRPIDELVDQLESLISESVASTMMADVPVGAFLSGGLDSSIVTSMMVRHTEKRIKTFNIGFTEPQYDETEAALTIANHLGTEHFYKKLEVNELLKLLPSFVDNFDEPFFDSAAFPTMQVAHLAREHVTVSLTGDGGDELFGGYHYYQIVDRLNPFLRWPMFLRKPVSLLIGRIAIHKMQLLSEAIKQPSVSSLFAFGRSIAKDFSSVLNQDVLSSTTGVQQLFEAEAGMFPRNLSASEIGMRLDCLHTLSEDYLQKTDCATMAYSLEARAPLLNKNLVEWAVQLPSIYKIKGHATKYLMRRLASRHLPEKIVNLPKRGFGVPIDAWLRGPLVGWARDRLNDKQAFDKLPLNQQRCLDLFEIHQSKNRNVHPLLWAILMLLEFNISFASRK